MNAFLGIVTVLSLGLASALAFLVWRLRHAERLRSNARVEALMQMASADAGITSASGATGVKPAPADPVLRLRPEAQPTAEVSFVTFDGRSLHTESLREDGLGRHAELFAEPDRQSPWGGRLAIAAALAILVAGSGALMTYTRDPQSQDDGGTSARAEGPLTASAGQATLELLSLQHEQEGASLTITGIVQNPRDSRPLDGIIATVFLFGADDALVANGRAPLDFTRLAPGDESPFLITVPAAAGVTRYRIGFRSSDGRVVGHLDRRSTGTPVARRE